MNQEEIVIEEMLWHIENSITDDMKDYSVYSQDIVQALVKVFCFYTLEKQQEELFTKYPQLEQFSG